MLERHPKIGLLVNNAGIPARTGFLDGDPERIELVTRVNYLGCVWCLRAFLPGLLAATPSDVVNIVSVAGTLTAGTSGPYAASKYAQLSFSRAIGRELASAGVRVHLVMPGFVETEGFPQRDVFPRIVHPVIAEPKDIADAVLKALDKQPARDLRALVLPPRGAGAGALSGRRRTLGRVGPAAKTGLGQTSITAGASGGILRVDVTEAVRVALVTGATRGAGRAIAVGLARAGFYVYATGRSSRTTGPSEIGRPETIEETGDLIEAAGGTGTALVVDHEDPASVADLVARIEREQGRLDLLVNDIFGGDRYMEWDKPLWEHDWAGGLRMLQMGVHTHLITCRAAIPLMLRTAEARGSQGLVVEMTEAPQRRMPSSGGTWASTMNWSRPTSSESSRG